MSDPKKDDMKFSVEKYLDQVKILTALATTLLISPILVLILRGDYAQDKEMIAALDQAKYLLIIADGLYLIAIISTYFIYSSVVGFTREGIYDVYRRATRLFSILQLTTIILGTIFLLIFFLKII